MRKFTKYPSGYIKADRHWRSKTECKTKNGKIVHEQNVSSIYNDQDYYVLYDADGNFVEKSLDFNYLHDKLYGINASTSVKASSDKASENDFSYLALFNGEILDVFDDFDEAKATLKSEIDVAIAGGNADGVDFGECWIETNDEDEEVMYIADGDDDYADYL